MQEQLNITSKQEFFRVLNNLTPTPFDKLHLILRTNSEAITQKISLDLTTRGGVFFHRHRVTFTHSTIAWPSYTEVTYKNITELEVIGNGRILEITIEGDRDE